MRHQFFRWSIIGCAIGKTLTTKAAKDTKGSDIFAHKLRGLRVLRGQSPFGWLGRAGEMAMSP
jgi:hypothetical protein